MPLVLIAVGIALVIAAIRGTLQTKSGGQEGLLNLLYDDFVGPGNFFAWIAAIGLIGALGYVRPLRPLSTALMVLLIIVFLLAANKGGKDFFSALNNQLVNRKTPGTTPGGGGLTIPDVPGLNTGTFNPILNSTLTDPSLNVIPFNPIAIGAPQ